MRMPVPDPSVIARRAEIARNLRALVGPDGVIDGADALRAYDCDGMSAYRQPPMLVALPRGTGEVVRVLKYCHAHNVRIVPRGAGTGLSGGALPLADAVTVGLARMNRIIEVDYANRCVVAEPGVTNLGVTDAVRSAGFYYAPDPSSQIACSIGGNVAENSGGVHCLKYGLTVHNVLGVELVLMDGEVVRLGGKHLDTPGLDLLGVVIGSEGLLGIVTQVTVRILKAPETARAMMMGFASNESAGDCVGRIISAGIIPGGMEMMDRPAIRASEEYAHAGYPLDVESLLLVELDGPAVEVEHLVKRVEEIARAAGATTLTISRDAAERERIWAGRKAAFPAIGRLSPDYLCMDGTIPRRKLPEVLAKIAELSRRYNLGVANVFHAGDGNLHPLILFDANVGDELDRAERFGADILRACIAAGGVLTGEHGVGIEKRDLMPEMFSPLDLEQQHRLKCAFDPSGLLNPGKVFPTLHRCADHGMMRVHKNETRFPDLPRF